MAKTEQEASEGAGALAMSPQEIIDVLRAAHETLDGFKAERYWSDEPTLEGVLDMIGECIDALRGIEDQIIEGGKL